MKGLAAGADDAVCARLGSVAATFALEHLGGTSHAYTWQEFKARYEQHFGSLKLASGTRHWHRHQRVPDACCRCLR